METASTFAVLPLDKILASKTNPRKRFNQDSLNDLAASIKTKGVMQPILVRPIKHDLIAEYEIVAGERRWRASQLAEMQSIPAMISDLDDIEALQLQIIENLQRQDLHPMEEAQGFKALLDNKDSKNWDADKLAAKVSKSRTYIYNSLKLNELCLYAQDMFFDEKFGRETAVLLARIPGEKLQTQATKEVVKGYGQQPFSFREAKSHLHSRYTLTLTDAKFDTNSKDLVPEAGACFSCPKRSGNYPELYSDIESADVCTDPDCFANKKAVHIEHVISLHRRVLQGEDAKKVMPHGATSYLTGGEYSKLEPYEKDNRFNKSYAELLGDDLPEPVLLIDDKRDIITLYEKTALREKIEEKIASGELIVPPEEPREKSEWDIKQEARRKLEETEEKRRSEILIKLADHLTPDTNTAALRVILDAISENFNFVAHPILEHYKFIGTWDEFLTSTQQTQFLTTNDVIKLLTMIVLSQYVELDYSWHSPEDNADDDGYKVLSSFMSNIDIDIDTFLDSETARTPPIAAQAEELSADEKTDTAALADAKPLPPGMQKSKDAWLKKQAKKDAKAIKDVSANADASNTSLAEPAQTNAGVTQ